MKNKCSSCKIPIEEGRLCNTCYYEKRKLQIKKATDRKVAKLQNSKEFAMQAVKSHVKNHFDWSSCHNDCFRASVKLSKSGRSGENLKHVKKKFERWLYHRQLGRTVFTELPLKQGRPDLIVITKEGFVWIEEIVNSEKEENLLRKGDVYPFKIHIVRCD